MIRRKCNLCKKTVLAKIISYDVHIRLIPEYDKILRPYTFFVPPHTSISSSIDILFSFKLDAVIKQTKF